MRRFHFASAAVLFLPSVLFATTIIPMVHIGNVGNAPDARVRDDGTSGYGGINYDYSIGKYEVTAGQYTDFLNAIAKTDPYQVYNTSQADAQYGCGIFRSGSSGNYSYSVDPAFVSRPVTYVSFFDASRFANWLHNGQPVGEQNGGTTEDGAYTLTPDGISSNTVTRNTGARWAVASENEWYKAAYHQPAQQGGDTDDYWLYPTSSNTITHADANYDYQIGATVDVGSYAPNSYGAYDMAGNVDEWCDTIIPQLNYARCLEGGMFANGDVVLSAFYRSPDGYASNETYFSGFRIVQIPGPASFSLLAAGGAFALIGRRRTSR